MWRKYALFPLLLMFLKLILLITFFGAFFIFSTDLKSAWNSVFFDTFFDFFKKYSFFVFFPTLKPDSQKTALKIIKCIYILQFFPCCTFLYFSPAVHSSISHLMYIPLFLTWCTFLYFSPAVHSSISHLLCIPHFPPAVHTPISHLLCIPHFPPAVHSPISHLLYIPLFLTCCTFPCFSPAVHSPVSHLLYIPLFLTCCTFPCFSPASHSYMSVIFLQFPPSRFW